MPDRTEIISEMERPMRMNPKKFSMWLFMVSVSMLFASLISAYIVRRAEGNWDVFSLPQIFTFSTFVIALSSATMQWAVSMARKDELGKMRIATAITAVLGVAFLVMQFIGWGNLVDINVYFAGNPSGSFLYVMSGLHGVHLISGVAFLLLILFDAFNYKIHSKRMNKMETCATYWHFLDAIWIVMFLFLVAYR